MKVFFKEQLSFGKPRMLAELNSAAAHIARPKRQDVPIAIVDDEPFPCLTLLKDHGFHLTQFNDIDNVQVVQAFPVVLCDIKGVGKKFKSRFEGAHVISELRKHYPAKVLYAYTGHQFDASFNKYFQLCNDVLKKDLDSDAWVEALDSAIKQATDVVHQWKRVRNHLLESDVPLFHILRLEDEYVETMLTKSDVFPSKGILSELPDDAKAMLKDFASTAVKTMLIGSSP